MWKPLNGCRIFPNISRASVTLAALKKVKENAQYKCFNKMHIAAITLLQNVFCLEIAPFELSEELKATLFCLALVSFLISTSFSLEDITLLTSAPLSLE